MRIDSKMNRHRTHHFGSNKIFQLRVNKTGFISTALLRKSILGMELISNILGTQKIVQEPVASQA